MITPSMVNLFFEINLIMLFQAGMAMLSGVLLKSCTPL